MCGIAGIYSFNKPIPESFNLSEDLILSTMEHRGPDDFGFYNDENCKLYFSRLSIIDLELGAQPMESNSKDLIIVFNGEIYNYKSLRSKLESKGIRFYTKSDTEVLINGYEYYGEKFLNQIRGIFSFAVYNKKTKKIILARDHTGVKPLYYYKDNEYLYFASEIKTLLKMDGVEKSINLKKISQYMNFLWVPHPSTMFDSISMLDPATLLIVDNHRVTKKTYWDLSTIEKNTDLTFLDQVEQLDVELKAVVGEQMVSDVPIGAFLSGGLDSSLIVAYMNQHRDDPVSTYSIGFEKSSLGQDVIGSDVEYARNLKDHLNIDYNEIMLNSDSSTILNKVVYHMDEPIADPAAMTTYLVCKAAVKKSKVILSGVGADEIFGGYPRYLANSISNYYRYIPAPFKRLLEEIILSSKVKNSSFVRGSKKFIKSYNKNFVKRYLGYLSYYTNKELKQLIHKNYFDDQNQIFKLHKDILDENYFDNELDKMMYLDVKTFLPNLNLLYTDKMSSANSTEVRVPYLDHKIIEMAFSMPGPFKLKKFTRKLILKKVAEKYLPKKNIWRKKAGFGAPIGSWINNQLKDMVLDLLSEDSINRRGYFNYKSINILLNQHFSGYNYNANQIWQLLILELWHREFMDV